MASRTTTEVTVTDDLDPTITVGVKTVTFAVNGQRHEIDLCEDNARVFLAVLAPYIAAGRKPSLAEILAVGAGRKAPTVSRPAGRRVTTVRLNREDHAANMATRNWARSHGWPDLGDRGRIPIGVQSAFDASHAA